jgi:hypothetical protein
VLTILCSPTLRGHSKLLSHPHVSTHSPTSVIRESHSICSRTIGRIKWNYLHQGLNTAPGTQYLFKNVSSFCGNLEYHSVFPRPAFSSKAFVVVVCLWRWEWNPGPHKRWAAPQPQDLRLAVEYFHSSAWRHMSLSNALLWMGLSLSLSLSTFFFLFLFLFFSFFQYWGLNSVHTT